MIEDKIKKMMKRIVITSFKAKEGHIASAFSILDILWILYHEILKYNWKEKKDNTEPIQLDKFILSKGHASLALYAILEEKGYLSEEELDKFCEFNSNLGGHPDSNKVKGVEASTGSLGHGMPIAVGMALSSKIKKIDNKIYCLIGDGECNEGTIWESALLASHHNLNNLCLIVDFNHSTDRALKLGNLVEKFKSFDWNVLEIDGHNHSQIKQALETITYEKPLVVIAETIKGHGIKSMENNPEWHHKFPNEEEMMLMIEELS